MNNQNRFLLPHQPPASTALPRSGSKGASDQAAGDQSGRPSSISVQDSSQGNEYQVDIDFDSYWEEEARNPHRNRIRIGRQYQATVPPLLIKLNGHGDGGNGGDGGDCRKLEELETLTFCPIKSAKLTNSELDHYFTVAKSLNLFASLVETRSLLGRDVTIADLNHIRHKEGLSLASVIQSSRQSVSSNANLTPQVTQSTTQTSSSATTIGQQKQSPQKCPATSSSDTNNKPLSSSSKTILSSPKETIQEMIPVNQPLMKALSHFISLHHPCYHDSNCKKLLKDSPIEDESVPAVSITAENLRCQTTPASSPSKESKLAIRSRSKHQSSVPAHVAKSEELESKDVAVVSGQDQASDDIDIQAGRTYEDWTREEIQLFSKAIEICGKNFGSIKKEFLPSKSVRSIVEYYYIGSRDASDNKKKPNQVVIETTDGCSSPEKSQANNNGQGGGGGNGGSGGNLLLSSKTGPGTNITSSANSASSTSGRSTSSGNNNTGKNLSNAIDKDKSVSMSQNVNDKINSHNLKQTKPDCSSNSKSKTTNIDARMSIYNFDDEIRDDNSPVVFDCPRPGAEVRPIKAKPILPIAPGDGEPGNSNVGSLKFFMDGQLVLKLNACQEQQEGGDKCHWVQSGDKPPAPSRQKKFNKRANDSSSELSQNGSQSNSVVSSNHDDNSKNDDLTGDEDSKESANSFTNIATTPRQKSFSASPTLKRIRTKSDTNLAPFQGHQHQQLQLTSPIDYNKLAVNNRMKEHNDSINLNNNINNNNNNNSAPLVDHAAAAAAAAAMPWIHANSFAMAAALLGGLPFPPTSSGLVGSPMPNNNNNNNNNPPGGFMSMASKPMDLSVEHNVPPKPIQDSKPSRSRSKHKK